MNEFYVYVYFDPRIKSSFKYGELEFEYEPFYVGKGKGLRMYQHLSQTGRCNKVNKINSIQKKGFEPIIVKHKECLTEKEAFELEIELIKTIGRKCLKEGPLTNISQGGKIGILHHTEETKQKMAEGFKKWKAQNQEKVKQIIEKRKATYKETLNHRMKENLLFGFKGMKHTEEAKAKISSFNSKHHIGGNNPQYNKCWINRMNECKMIERDVIDEYIGQGWKKGRINLANKEKHSQYGTCWITRKGENRKIKKEEIDEWISEGWKKGRVL